MVSNFGCDLPESISSESSNNLSLWFSMTSSIYFNNLWKKRPWVGAGYDFHLVYKVQVHVLLRMTQHEQRTKKEDAK